MNIALIGCGNMGKEIQQITGKSLEHSIISVSCTRKSPALDIKGIAKADVAIDFTSPDVVLHNIREVCRARVPLVVGTTGWYEHLDDVHTWVTQNDTGLIYGQNFSIGANIFFQIVAYASLLFSRFAAPVEGGYDVFAHEIHHTGKKDSPSGTARKLAEIVLENFPAKKSVQTETLDRRIEAPELHFSSSRGGRNRGRHTIYFDSEADEISLTHQAHGRRGFAEGAIVAAEFIRARKGLYTFDDIFKKTYA